MTTMGWQRPWKGLFYVYSDDNFITSGTGLSLL